jgi:RNA polymerase sigma factor (sigma-70 family)
MLSVAMERSLPDLVAASVGTPSPAKVERLEALVRDYGRLIASAVRRVGRSLPEHDRADVEQAILTSLWQQVAREQTIAHPSSYIFRAAIRETVRAVRQVRRRAEASLDDAGRVAADELGGPDALLGRREVREAVASALKQLPPDRARAARAHLAGLSPGEMQELYGWSYQRARNLVARGMADLWAAMKANERP